MCLANAYSTNCVSTLLALYIEIALDSSAPSIQKSMSPVHIRSNMLVLKRCQERVPMTRWAVKLFEWVISYKNLLNANDPSDISNPAAKEAAACETCKTSLQSSTLSSLLPHSFPEDIIDASGVLQDSFGFDFIDSIDMPQWET